MLGFPVDFVVVKVFRNLLFVRPCCRDCDDAVEERQGDLYQVREGQTRSDRREPCGAQSWRPTYGTGHQQTDGRFVTETLIIIIRY